MTDLLVLGGSGRTGTHVLAQAAERGHRVRALVRDPSAVHAPTGTGRREIPDRDRGMGSRRPGRRAHHPRRPQPRTRRAHRPGRSHRAPILQRVDGDAFDEAIGAWLAARDPDRPPPDHDLGRRARRSLAVDGKTVRGARRVD
uniref:NAD(P)H-binding protein n=1 Tax=Streptomyces antimycoticus TaxID=68175 RepID=UPI00191BA2BF